MKIVLDPNKNVYENAAVYFEKAKKLKKKIEEIKKVIEKTKKELENAEKEEKIEKEKIKFEIETRSGRKKEGEKKAEEEMEGEKMEKEERKEERKKEEMGGGEKEWYKRFRWFFSNEGFLAIGGKNADQNEEIVKKYFSKDDLFFHADVRGGSVVILKNGVTSSESTLREAAQFAACFSNAWKEGLATIDVYCVRKEQVSKSPPSGEYIEKGSFVISGERKFFKNVPLILIVGKNEAGVSIVPKETGDERFLVSFELIPGGDEKDKVSELLSKELNVKKDVVLSLLPSGRIYFKKLK